MTSKYRRESGNLSIPLAVVVIMGIVTAMITYMSMFLLNSTQKKIAQARVSLTNTSGAETMLTAYHLAEVKYISALGNCSKAVPFLDALSLGSGCSGVTVSVFNQESPPTDSGVINGMYSFPGAGCTITETSSSCSTGLTEVLDTNVKNEQASATAADYGYKFYMNAVHPDRKQVDFLAVYTDGKYNSKYSFSIRASLTNAAHLESATLVTGAKQSTVSQENPDPLAECPGARWAIFQVFDPLSKKCLVFDSAGTATGLALYHAKYFGFDPANGQVTDLLAGAQGKARAVQEDGTLDSQKDFPAYSKNALINMDDITVINEQVYYVGGQGDSTQIGILDPSTRDGRQPLCYLGKAMNSQKVGNVKLTSQGGWSQSYLGIAALGSSDPLYPVSGDQLESRIATFFIKSSGGDLLTAVILANRKSSDFRCYVFKSASLQADEYSRTFGFERTAGARPYYIF